MSAISGIDTTSNPALTQAAQQTSMGKDDFLKLLIAQLQNQDPMNPSDPTQFTAQLAQFSQLEQLNNINDGLKGLTDMSSSMQQMSALSLMGQDVVAKTDRFHYNGEPVQLGYNLDEQAADVKMYILGPTGATLATLSPQETDPGQYFVDWNGTSSTGVPLEPGNYSLAVQAYDQDQKALSADSLIKGTVTAVEMNGSDSQLETSAGLIPMSKIEKAGASL